MGLRLGILVASLVANVALAVLIFRHAPPSPPIVDGIKAPATPASPTRLAARPRAKESRSQEAPDLPSPPVSTFDWSQLESPDYKEYIARLRAFGVPERVLRDIIIADVNKLYRPKLAPLRPPSRAIKTNFWEQFGGPTTPRQPREQREQLRALEKEQTDLIKDLLGKDVYEQKAADAGYPDSMEQVYGAMTIEQREAVSEIQERYQRMKSDIYEENEFHIDSEAQDQIKAVHRKLREELATVLKPEQIENYELRTSDTASNLRYELRSFEPNEEEFRAIFKYKQAKEDLEAMRNADVPGVRPSSEEMNALQTKQKEIDDALAQSLNEDRAKEFKLSENYEYRNLFEAGVEKESIFKLADMKQDVETAARKLRQDKALSEEQRTAALAAIRAETEKSLGDLLGERRARGYLGNSGFWIRNLAPKP